MARVSRLAGAILAETEGRYFLVGDLKEPCDWAASGFVSPGEITVEDRTFVELFPTRENVELAAPVVAMDVEEEVLAQRLVDLFVIDRNGSVSERLWTLATCEGEDNDRQGRWLGEVPLVVWNIVRESVLRCL